MAARINIRRLVGLACLCAGSFLFSMGATCGTGGPGDDLNPDVPDGNRPPRAQITSVITPSNDNLAEQGENVIINFTGDDGEDVCTVRVFASRSATPTPAQELAIASGITIGPGAGSGQATWNTTGVPIAPYFIFVEISDQTYDPASDTGNPPVRVVWGSTIQIAPPGSRPRNDPPRLVFLEPAANMGLSSQDMMTLRYVYSDTDNLVTVTLLLDKDLNPTNDNINNPGDPLDPNSNIIILPSEQRRPTDPTFDGDPPPPDNPNTPPGSADSLQVRTNPRVLGQTAPGVFPPEAPNSPIPGEYKEYVFNIDFAQIPVRTEPYYIRATIKDETHTVHAYAVGSLTITSLANGVVLAGDLGFSVSGARYHGFSAFENLGTQFVAATDLDGDGNADFVVGSRYGSPRNRNQAGAAYLIFGRSKTPFPLDTNGNGRPDVIDGNGNTVDFPPVPTYLPDPYDAVNVGRFGGINSINSVGSFFRGVAYGMPLAHSNTLPPLSLRDANHPGIFTSGLTSITRVDLTADGVADIIFGIPFISGNWDNHDDDPCDNGMGAYLDGWPNELNCSQCGNDDIWTFPTPGHCTSGETVDQGTVFVVSGTNNLRDIFKVFLDVGIAGQHDVVVTDDEGFLRTGDQIPVGFRYRGGWFGGASVLDDLSPPVNPTTEYGYRVSAVASIGNDAFEDLAISIPNFDNGRGRIQIWLVEQPNGVITNYLIQGHGGQPCRSYPAYACVGNPCVRGFFVPPNYGSIVGRDQGDRLGGAGPAGQFNQDGVADVMAGAPGADRRSIEDPNGPILVDNGVFYVFFTPAGGFGNTELLGENVPRVEIIGTHSGDRFGDVQTIVRDMNGDSIDDVALASENFDNPITGDLDAGYVGVIFGNRPLTGENGFSPNTVGTPQLSGVRFLGPTIGARAGHALSSAGDFNRDGYGDLVIASPGERRIVNVGDKNNDGIDDFETRLGVAYLVFGGTHLINQTFNLSQVGSPELPGIVFISRFVLGSEDEAPIDNVGLLGDIDGDGFDDIAIAATTADFVNPASPDQRRNDAGEFYIIYGNNFGSNNFQLNP